MHCSPRFTSPQTGPGHRSQAMTPHGSRHRQVKSSKQGRAITCRFCGSVTSRYPVSRRSSDSSCRIRRRCRQSPVPLSPWRSQLRHSLHLTSRFTLSLVSPGYIPGGPQLASYSADARSGFPWVHSRGTTGQLPTRRRSLRFPLGTFQGDHNWPATYPPTLAPVSPGYIPGGPQLASYRLAPRR